MTEEEVVEEYEVEVYDEEVEAYSVEVDGEEVCTIDQTESTFVLAVSHNEAEGKLLTRCC